VTTGRSLVIAAGLMAGVALAAPAPLPAQQQEVRSTITGESGRLPRLAIPAFLLADNAAPLQDAAATVAEVLWKDLEFERAYEMVPPALAQSIAPAPLEALEHERWAATGTDDVLVGSVQQNGGSLRIDVRVLNLASRKSVFGRRYDCPGANLRLCAHTISDELHKVRFGVEGVARTKLAFTSDRDAEGDSWEKRTSVKEIYITDYDGERVSRVTTRGSLNLGPAWSPDSRSFAYQSYQLGFADIFVQRLYEPTAPLLRPAQGTEHQQNYLPAWSPDGRRIAYVSSRDGDWEIYVMKVDGSDRRRLTSNPADDGAPAWSPSGTQIAFTSDRDGTNQIYIMSAEGGPAEQVTHAPMGVDRPTWSRQNVIAYTLKTVEGTEIQTINLDTRQVVSLTDGPGTSESPTFAPNGRHIAFVTTRWGKQHVAIMDLDGNRVRQVTFIGNNRFPTWSAGPLEK
jgi:TolB protein